MAAKAKKVELAEAFIEAFSGVFRNQSNIQDGASCENSSWH